MGIKALPNTTIRALGASQVLNDPASVVKELIDNALDARATSIAIEISNNTVDHIQVRDNGHGIPPEDRPLIARPHCTSKITCEDDLNVIGGTSLGFRGEAMASIAEMSSFLTISTRVEGEQVAVALKINKQGEITGQEKASLPVGTTVKITGFVKDYPVRNQNALKNSDKCLKRIKQMLKSYAFARLHVRLSVRVLKSKNDSLNWTYAPKLDGNAEDAAFKIVGSACASQCGWSVIEEQGFTMQAFLPKVDGEVNKISNVGPFLSVDGRPVSTSRGTPKQIAKMFREALKKANVAFDAIKDAFLYMEIACPESSYDANVEPAKDDVLFENPDVVVGLAWRLFSTIYPPVEVIRPQEVKVDVVPGTPLQHAPSPERDDFITSLEPGYTGESSPRQTTRSLPPLIPDGAIQELADRFCDDASEMRGSVSQRTFRSNMYGCDEEDLDLLDMRPSTGRTEAEFEELRQARKDVNVCNPWVMAKLHSSKRPAQPQEASGVPTENVPGARYGYNLEEPGFETAHLPTPRPSSPSPASQSHSAPHYTFSVQSSSDAPSIGAQGLPPPQAVMLPSTAERNEYDDSHSIIEGVQQRPGYEYNLSSQVSEPSTGTPLHAIPFAETKAQRRQQNPSNHNKPFKPPLKDRPQREKVWFDHLENNNRGTYRSGGKRHAQQQDAHAGLVHQGDLGDLAEDARPLTPPGRNRDMRDYLTHLDLTGDDSVASLIEARHYPQRRRNFIEADLDPVAGVEDAEAVHTPAEKQAQRTAKRRKTSGGRAMREISGNARSQDGNEEYVPSAGARAPSRRRSTRSRRLKSSQLPLERVPAGQGLHNLILTTTTTIREISHLADDIDQAGSLLKWSEDGAGAYDAFANILPQERQVLAGNLYEIIVNQVSDGEMVQDLQELVESALEAHNG